MVLVVSFAACTLDAKSQSNTSEPAEGFVKALIHGETMMNKFVLPEELELSHRLRIEYEGVPNKFLIGFHFDEETRQALASGRLNYETSFESLDDGYSRVSVKVAGARETRSFFFKDKFLVSPIYYYTRTWSRRESKHFLFLVSDSTQFHPDAIRQLETFVERMSKLLDLDRSDLKTLEQNKITYVLCRDEEEIKTLTGHKSRGMYLLAYDYLITTYNCHFHELVHLLVNFKMRRLPLFTHPMLREGVAVAYGGRGGIAPHTLLQGGVYLLKSEFVEKQDLLAADSFSRMDPSVSYSAGGALVKFLVKGMGMKNFLDLYRLHSGSSKEVNSMVIDTLKLPMRSQWNGFLTSLSDSGDIRLSSSTKEALSILQTDSVQISEAGDYLHIAMKGAFGLLPSEVVQGYSSKLFKELLPGKTYRGEHYLFLADSNEVIVYDLYSNNSIAGYSSGFSVSQERIPSHQGFYEFWLRRGVFEHGLNDFQVVIY